MTGWKDHLKENKNDIGILLIAIIAIIMIFISFFNMPGDWENPTKTLNYIIFLCLGLVLLLITPLFFEKNK